MTSYDTPHQVRVRCWSLCTVNGREEQLWSSYSPTVHCHCVSEVTKDEGKEVKLTGSQGKETSSTALVKPAMSHQVRAMLVFGVVSLLTLLLAFLVGQYTL